jgi:hypothetical protein
MAMMSDPRVPDPAPDPTRPPEPPEMPPQPEPIDVPSPVPDDVPPPNEPVGVPPTPPPEIPAVSMTTAKRLQRPGHYPQRRLVTMPARSTSTFSRFASRSVV